MSSDNRIEMPYASSSLPGIGGQIKRYNEDFYVEEIPLYEPSGSGTHVYALIEKNGLSTPDAIRQVTRSLNRHPRDIGYAGLKDAHAVTRQWISIEHIDPAELQSLQLDRVQVLSISRHTNKIKIGHLAGNRFVIRVRNAKTPDPQRVEAILNFLSERGAPNFFGEQRFGARGDNAAVGHAILRGDVNEAVAIICGYPSDQDTNEVRRARELFDAGRYSEAANAWPKRAPLPRRICITMQKTQGNAEKGWRSVDRKMASLYLSAVQSAFFNRILADRIDSYHILQDGDVAWKHANGACFLVENARTEQPRCDAFEISPTGPLFGKKMKWPEGTPGHAENKMLKESGITMKQLRDVRPRLEGARRPLRIQPGQCSVLDGSDQNGKYVEVGFSLPPGCYATTVMREICR